LELRIAIIAALAFIVIFNNRLLQNGFIFEWGSLLFFFSLFTLVVATPNNWCIINAPLLAFYTLAITCWISIILRKPIAMQYAKLNVTKELWSTSLFYRVNNIVTVLWALVFSIISMLYTVHKFVWGGTLWLTTLIPTTLLLLITWFTFWFPEWYKRTVIGEWGVINIKNLSEINIAHAHTANIAFRSLGRGQKLIMLPPSHMNMYGWDPELLRVLSRKFEVIILDYPDIGASKLKNGEYTVKNLAHAIGEFITNLTDEKVALCGYSMGGWVAQQVTLDYPDSVSRLTLIATDVGSPRSSRADDDTRAILLDNSSAFDVENDALLERLFPQEHLRQMAPKLRAIFTAANFKENISHSIVLLQQHLAESWYRGDGTYQRLNQIEADTLVISGGQDRIVNRQNSSLLANGIPGAMLVEYPDSGHGVVFEHPTAVAEEMLEL
jgi:pimeloyl-ACP methyl ester carboxylesterase